MMKPDIFTVERNKNLPQAETQPLSQKSMEILVKYGLEFAAKPLSEIKNIEQLLATSYGKIVITQLASEYLESHAEKRISALARATFSMLSEIHEYFQDRLSAIKSRQKDPVRACVESFGQTMEKFRIKYVDTGDYSGAIANRYLDCDTSAYLFADLVAYSGLKSNSVNAAPKHEIAEIERPFYTPEYVETSCLLFGRRQLYKYSDIVRSLDQIKKDYGTRPGPTKVLYLFEEVLRLNQELLSETGIYALQGHIENSKPKPGKDKITVGTDSFLAGIRRINTVSAKTKVEVLIEAMKAKTFVNRANDKSLGVNWKLLEDALVGQLRFISETEEHMSAKEKIALFEQAAKAVSSKNAASAVELFRQQQLSYLKKHPEEK